LILIFALFVFCCIETLGDLRRSFASTCTQVQTQNKNSNIPYNILTMKSIGITCTPTGEQCKILYTRYGQEYFIVIMLQIQPKTT
jgi:hypothetical protein